MRNQPERVSGIVFVTVSMEKSLFTWIYGFCGAVQQDNALPP